VLFQMPMDAAELNRILAELDAEVVRALDRDGLPEEARDIRYVLEMRYGAQVHEVRLPIERREYDAAAVAALSERFDAAYEKLYGKGSGYGDAGRFLINAVVEGFGHLPVPDRHVPQTKPASAGERGLIGTRRCYFGGEYVSTNIYRYEELRSGDQVTAPAPKNIERATVGIVLERRLHLRGQGMEALPHVGDAAGQIDPDFTGGQHQRPSRAASTQRNTVSSTPPSRRTMLHE